MSYDAEGTKTVFQVYIDVAQMRASGKYSATQLKDTIATRIKSGVYKAPAKGGISYMLAPVMRAYETDPDNKNIVRVSVPHYMFYAHYSTNEFIIVNQFLCFALFSKHHSAVFGIIKAPAFLTLLV